MIHLVLYRSMAIPSCRVEHMCTRPPAQLNMAQPPNTSQPGHYRDTRQSFSPEEQEHIAYCITEMSCIRSESENFPRQYPTSRSFPGTETDIVTALRMGPNINSKANLAPTLLVHLI